MRLALKKQIHVSTENVNMFPIHIVDINGLQAIDVSDEGSNALCNFHGHILYLS